MLCDSLHAKFLTEPWFNNYAAFFICTQVGRASDSDDGPDIKLVGARASCLLLGPRVKLVFFFCSGFQ